MAIVTSALFFVTFLLHELAHCLVAKSRVPAITLFALGDVLPIETQAPDAKTLQSSGFETVCAISCSRLDSQLGNRLIGNGGFRGSPAKPSLVSQ